MLWQGLACGQVHARLAVTNRKAQHIVTQVTSLRPCARRRDEETPDYSLDQRSWLHALTRKNMLAPHGKLSRAAHEGSSQRRTMSSASAFAR